MRESCTYGSERGARGNSRPYRNRRDFITLAAVAAAESAWPIAARAQQPMPVIGFFRSTGAADFSHLVAAFQAGLNKAGYTEGRNVAV